MKQKELKAALDAVTPDNYMKTRITAQIKERTRGVKPKRLRVKALVAVALSLVLTVGVIGYDLYGHRTVVPEETVAPSGMLFADGRIPGGMIYAYAEEGVEKETALNTDGINIPGNFHIAFFRKAGLSEEEIERASQALYDSMELTGPSDVDFPNGAFIGHDDNEAIERRTFMEGSFRLDLTEEELAHLASIHFYGENEWMQFFYDSPSEFYGDALRLDGTPQEPDYANQTADFEMSGEHYRRNVQYYYQLLREEGFEDADRRSAVRFFYQTKDYPAPSFSDMLVENPDFVISDLKDVLHFEVYFTDGSYTETVVQVTFNENGYMNIAPSVCRYVTAEERAEAATEEVTVSETEAVTEAVPPEEPAAAGERAEETADSEPAVAEEPQLPAPSVDDSVDQTQKVG